MYLLIQVKTKIITFKIQVFSRYRTSSD